MPARMASERLENFIDLDREESWRRVSSSIEADMMVMLIILITWLKKLCRKLITKLLKVNNDKNWMVQHGA